MDKYLKKFNSKKSYLYLAVIVAIIITAIFLASDLTAADIESIGHEVNEKQNNSEASLEIESTVFVDICGEVNKPGVYEVQAGSRIFEVIEKAGGLTKKACIDSINRAEKVTDGQKLIIPSKNKSIQVSSSSQSDLININTASSEELQKLNGVGPATAEKIISYRESVGNFNNIQDLTKVSGIGEKTFEKLKDKICI